MVTSALAVPASKGSKKVAAAAAQMNLFMPVLPIERMTESRPAPIVILYKHYPGVNEPELPTIA
jgi:hypothetical protein